VAIEYKYLKMKKIYRNMKKEGLILAFALILFLPLTLALNNNFQRQSVNQADKTIYDRIVVSYDKSASDYIKGDRPLEIQFLYSLYPKTWNLDNPDYYVTSCNFTVDKYSPSLNNATQHFENIVLANDPDTAQQSYFVTLSDGEYAFATTSCKFAQVTTSFPAKPSTLQAVMPTLECKACQLYEWSKQEITASNIAKRNTGISSIVQDFSNLISLVFTIIIPLFWVFLILLLFFSIGLIFMGLFFIVNLFKTWLQ
jgi:hypothetical protein